MPQPIHRTVGRSVVFTSPLVLVAADVADVRPARPARPTAAAIEQGARVPTVDADRDGEMRPSGGGYDIGADEREATIAASSKQQQPVSIVCTGRRCATD